MSSELRCASCQDYLFRSPVQCSCGERLCGICFNSLSNCKTKFTCPQCKTEVLVEECFRDRAATIELRKTTIQCSHPGCAWQGMSAAFEDHCKTCKFVTLPCPYQKYGCSEKQARSDMAIHEAKCIFKPTQCLWCGQYIQDEKVHLMDECTLVPEYCTNECGEKIPRKDMEQHMKLTCAYRMNCNFRDSVGNNEEEHHHYDNDASKTSKGILTNKVDQLLDVRLRTLMQQISDLKSEINHVNREITVKMQPLVTAMGKAETAILNMQEGFSELALIVQTLQATSYDGAFIWKIPQIQRRKHEAKTGKTVSLYSAPFFSSRHGYKVCLRLYMDGDGCGKGKYLSFFLTVMKGEYDALLPWPFELTVTLMLLDQDHDRHIAQSFKPETNSSSFHRPRNEMNIASGCPMFAPLSILNNSSYVKDDTMFLKCKMSSSGINEL